MSIPRIEGMPLKTRKPFDWFNSLLHNSNGKGYAIALNGKYSPEYSTSWKLSIENYQKVVDAYGEQKVLAAVEKIRQAPKTEAGLIAGNPPIRPAIMIRELLAGPNGHYPTDPPVHRIAATDIEGLKKAFDRTKRTGPLEKVTVVYGVVAKVTKEYRLGMEPPTNFPISEEVMKIYEKRKSPVIYFKNVPGDAVKVYYGALARHVSIWGIEKVSDLEGKTIEIWSGALVDDRDHKIKFTLNYAHQLKILPEKEGGGD